VTRILITGSRNWSDRQAVWDALDLAAAEYGIDTLTVVHGGCPTGADDAATRWAFQRGVTLDVFLARWQTEGRRAAGPLRNRRMVEAGADLCLAFPLGESRGTRGCMALATAAGIPVKECTP
jgi:hypothetical protein